MIARNLISETVPSLKPSDTGEKALQWMNEFHLQHLPLVDRQELKGMISEYDILDLQDADLALDNLELDSSVPSANEMEHIYDVIKIMSRNKLSAVPVLSNENQYLGIVTQQSLVDFFASASAFQDPGGILVLEMKTTDYSMVELAQIIEGNDASILSSYVSPLPDSELLQITLKLNRSDLTSVLATLERYDYNVKASYQEEDSDDFLRDRLESFMNYLNM